MKPFGLMIAITLVVGFRASGQEPIEHLTADQKVYETMYDPTPLAVPPHLVLEPPKARYHVRTREFESEVVTDSGQDRSAEHHASAGVLPHEKVAKHFLHADKTTRAVPIPGATRAPMWKTPYSYGHFGASRNRQWSLQHGYQNAYTQWTLR